MTEYRKHRLVYKRNNPYISQDLVEIEAQSRFSRRLFICKGKLGLPKAERVIIVTDISDTSMLHNDGWLTEAAFNRVWPKKAVRNPIESMARFAGLLPKHASRVVRP